MTPTYCVECYRLDGKGTVEAPYFFNGKSLCNLHLWSEIDEPTPNLPAVVDQPKSKRGTRLPTGYVPAESTINGIRGEFPFVTNEDLTAAHREFCDYWVGVPGQRGVKLDWEATWRNSMRREFNGKRWDSRRRGANSTVDQKIIDMQGKKQ